MARTLVVLAAALFLTLSLQIPAQNPAPTTPGLTDEQLKAKQELERKGAQLLLETVPEIGLLRTGYNRARSYALAGSLLWKFDETRARSFIQQAQEEFQHIFGAEDPNDMNYMGRFYTLQQLRREMFQSISPLDPQVALDFLHATKLPPPAQMGSRFASIDQDAGLELELALRLVKTDPQRALEIGEAAVALGPSPQVITLLNLLRAGNPDAAGALMNDLLKAFASGKLNTNNQAFYAAYNLLQIGLRSKSTPVQAPGTGQIQPLQLSDASMGLLVSYLASAIAAAKDDSAGPGGGYYSNFVQASSSLLPDLQKFGLMTDALRTAIGSGASSINPGQQAWTDFQALQAKNPSVDALIQAAASAPMQTRNNYYQAASNQAVNAGDYDRARQILNDNVSAEAKSNMLDNLNFQILINLGQKGNFEQARQLALGLSKIQNRVNGLLQLSRIAGQKKDLSLALNLTDDARNLLTVPPENIQQLSSLLAVAETFASLKSKHGLDLLDPLPPQMNQLISASLLIDSYMQPDNPAIREGELTFVGGFGLSSSIQQISNALESLCVNDFDDAKSVADHFQPVEVRVRLHLALARAALGGASNEAQSGFFFGIVR
ncbi:MAG: hypothetical protein PHX83_08010 [Acidobacteriia bacterium]|nr:hypothetical protein [Terriglobia bacterium]